MPTRSRGEKIYPNHLNDLITQLNNLNEFYKARSKQGSSLPNFTLLPIQSGHKIYKSHFDTVLSNVRQFCCPSDSSCSSFSNTYITQDYINEIYNKILNKIPRTEVCWTCDQYNSCSCHGVCNSYRPCSCDSSSFGFVDCSCNQRCDQESCSNNIIKTCYCNVNDYNHCVCYNKQYNYCQCDSQCVSYSYNCPCNYTCNGYNSCSTGYSCYCYGTCYGYHQYSSVCSCNGTCNGFSGSCSSGYSCSNFQVCTSYSLSVGSPYNYCSPHTSFVCKPHSVTCNCESCNTYNCTGNTSCIGFSPCSCNISNYNGKCECESKYGLQCYQCYSVEYTCSTYNKDCTSHTFTPYVPSCGLYNQGTGYNYTGICPTHTYRNPRTRCGTQSFTCSYHNVTNCSCNGINSCGCNSATHYYCQSYNVPYNTCRCNTGYTPPTWSCKCNSSCVQYCNCNQKCHGYSPCSCNNTCHGYSCSCYNICYGYSQGTPCSCNNICHGYTQCSCNNTCHGYVQSSPCSCNNSCYEYLPCSCNNTCFGYRQGSSCSCNNTCHGYSQCSCNNTCHGYRQPVPCTCDNTCYGFNCSCNSTCNGYSQCSCNNTCNINVPCQCDNSCNPYTPSN